MPLMISEFKCFLLFFKTKKEFSLAKILESTTFSSLSLRSKVTEKTKGHASQETTSSSIFCLHLGMMHRKTHWWLWVILKCLKRRLFHRIITSGGWDAQFVVPKTSKNVDYGFSMRRWNELIQVGHWIPEAKFEGSTGYECDDCNLRQVYFYRKCSPVETMPIFEWNQYQSQYI